MITRSCVLVLVEVSVETSAVLRAENRAEAGGRKGKLRRKIAGEREVLGLVGRTRIAGREGNRSAPIFGERGRRLKSEGA